MKKNLLIFISLMLISAYAHSQAVGIGDVSFTPNYLLQIHRNAASGVALQLTNTTTGALSTDGFQINLNGAAIELNNKENEDMRFFTNNTERMTIEAAGNVGIGTATPSAAYKLDVQGGSMNVGALYGTYVMYGTLGSYDTRATNPLPSTFNMGVVSEFKSNAANGLNDGGSYNSVITNRAWSAGADWSGGGVAQLSFTANGNLWMRYGTAAWGAWKKLLSSTDISGTTNYIAKFTSANTIGNSQVFDNGTNVGIGTAGPTYKLHVMGDIYANGGWLRSSGNTGWYNESYGGGWYMVDATWIRAYNNKTVLATGGLAGYGNSVFGTPFNASPRIYANYDNLTGGGIAISDDGGFYDYNDGWIQSRATNGLDMRSNNTTWNTVFRMGNQDNSGTNDKYVATGTDAWGYIGASGNSFWRGYSYGWITASQREKKRDITPIEGDLANWVMSDLDKLKPSFYKYNVETDQYDEKMPMKYRPNMHLGLILEESPDYIQDDLFTGIDNYSLATLGVLGAKVNQQEINKLKKNVQDFGSVLISNIETWVDFSDEFKQAIGDQDNPVVTVATNTDGVYASIIEKNNSGFKIKINHLAPGLSIDYIAMGKSINIKSDGNKVQWEQNMPTNLLKALRVDESIKTEQKNRLEVIKSVQANSEKNAKSDGELIHQNKVKELEKLENQPTKEIHQNRNN